MHWGLLESRVECIVTGGATNTVTARKKRHFAMGWKLVCKELKQFSDCR